MVCIILYFFQYIDNFLREYRTDLGAFGQWKWIADNSETAEVDFSGKYGDGTFMESNYPGSRTRLGKHKTETSLWIFGGWGYTAENIGALCDLWEYTVPTSRSLFFFKEFFIYFLHFFIF